MSRVYSAMHRFEFASDNTAGITPEALAAIVEANNDFYGSYGEDTYTKQAIEAFHAYFELPSEVFFVSTGTAANSLALAQLCRSHHAIICHEFAHIETDECSAPEFFNNGVKLLPVSGDDCKLTPQSVRQLATNRTDVHFPRARVLSLTLPTEAGTVYTLDELRALRDAARENKLSIHIDGARFVNAVASLGCSPRDIIEASGADVLCFGGTKAGFGLTEAVLFFNRDLVEEFNYRCKQAGQLPSKMRLLSAPWAKMLSNDNWFRYAQLANNAAQRLEKIFRDNGFEPLFPVQANAVFVNLPPEVSTQLEEIGWHFYPFFDTASRFMCSWNIGPSVLEAFERDLKSTLA